MTWTEGGGRRVALSETTVEEGALITAGATATETVARSWAWQAADTRATTFLMVMVGFRPTTLEHSLETAKGAVSAFLPMAASTPAMLLIPTRGTEWTIQGVNMARRSGTMRICGARSLCSWRAPLRLTERSSLSQMPGETWAPWWCRRPLLLPPNLAVESRNPSFRSRWTGGGEVGLPEVEEEAGGGRGAPATSEVVAPHEGSSMMMESSPGKPDCRGWDVVERATVRTTEELPPCLVSKPWNTVCGGQQRGGQQTGGRRGLGSARRILERRRMQGMGARASVFRVFLADLV